MSNNEILFKPNSLILATSNCDDITSSEYKIFDTLLQRCQYHKGHGFREAELSRLEIKDIIKHEENTTISEITNTLDKFKDITLKFTLNKKFVSSNALAQHVYDPEKDIFKCSMTEEVFTVLMNYATDGYSPIDLQIVRKAKRYYTQKMYQLFRMWSRPNMRISKVFTLEEIKNICDIKNVKSYEKYKEFKRRVLNPVIEEINKKLNMKIDYNEIKTVRKVTSIEFIILDYEPRKYNFNENKENIIEVKSKRDNQLKVEIDSKDYVDLIDAGINQSVHEILIKDYPQFMDIKKHIEKASKRTLDTIGGKTINKRNYKYFISTLESLLPSI